MKNIRYIGIFLCTLFLLTACEKETEGISGVVDFELLGESTVLVELGTAYQESGYKVTYRGEDVTSEIKVDGTIDANTVGLYTIAYSYANKDGVKITRTREVIVADPSVTTDISGDYLTADGTFRLASGVTENYPGFNVSITRIATGFFGISDFLGGYYAQKRGNGGAYACSGYIQLKNDNTITLLSSSILPWQDTLTALTEGKYDPATGVVSWKAEYAEMFFTVVLNKNLKEK